MKKLIEIIVSIVLFGGGLAFLIKYLKTMSDIWFFSAIILFIILIILLGYTSMKKNTS